MVRSIHKINIIFIITLLIGAVAVLQNGSSVNADTENVDFNVNVTEALTVSISTPTSWASGDADNLLRNKVTVSALTNNNSGVTVSMYAANTDLQNTTSYSSTDATTYIPTLDATTYTYNTFPSNAWGYSLEDSVAGTASASYLPMTDDTTAPIAVLNSTLGSQGSQDVYFGAKASTAKKAGTYAQTVYFTAVTGTIDSDNPKDPEYPSTPTDPTNTPTYDSNTGNPKTGQTTYTRRTTSGSGTSSVSGTTENTTTQVTKGDTTSSYVRAAGVTSTTPTTTTTDNVSTLGIALASAAGVAAVSGIAFLVAAKRRKDDDED